MMYPGVAHPAASPHMIGILSRRPASTGLSESQMNRTLSQVVSDITGATGMAKALQGTWRAEHLCALQPAVAMCQVVQG